MELFRNRAPVFNFILVVISFEFLNNLSRHDPVQTFCYHIVNYLQPVVQAAKEKAHHVLTPLFGI